MISTMHVMLGTFYINSNIIHANHGERQTFVCFSRICTLNDAPALDVARLSPSLKTSYDKTCREI